MIKIPTPSESFASQKVSLAGKTYEFVFRYNAYADVWQLDIFLNKQAVITGQSLVVSSPLFYAKPIKNFDHGVLLVLRNSESKERLGRNNLGLNKLYSLYYYSNAEWEELQNG